MQPITVEITIGGEKKRLTPGLVLGHSLLNLGGIQPPNQLLLEVHNDLDIPVGPSDGILIRGGEVFSVGDGDPIIEDNPCLRHPVHFHFNGHPVKPSDLSSKAKVLGRELKQLDPNLSPGDKLYADLEGLADEQISDDLRLILQHKDRFITVPCGNVGFDVVQLHLEEVQRAYPEARIEEHGNQRYLVVPNFPAPPHWQHSKVTLLAQIPNGYPAAWMDMFWVDPPLRLQDGREPEAAQVYEHHLGKQWQRFSWHYTDAQKAWRPGHSCLNTHLQFCADRLQQPK